MKKEKKAGKKGLAPQQERSRESLRKLLKAAAEVLGQHGVEGTTIPRIAQHAGLTPGAVYRRFHDKEALLEEVILGILQRQEERMKTGITPEKAAQIPLPLFAEQVIGGMVISYRANAALLRGMRMFAQSRQQTAFHRKISRLEARSFDRVIELFLAHRKEVKHPDPRTAITLGIMFISSMLYEWVVMPLDVEFWKRFLPKDDPALKRELTRAFLSYLEAEKPSD
ncbi:MAG TPA: TetR/AcrR family transcriptional regulator [Candidatus Angelobacter sp.]|nr:TetR/AcrR family transcriptional regulator [Candidatus Angelobacter sp.]